jgi:PncC family amidohydrolase
MTTDWNAIGAYLEDHGLVLASAESCTAGAVAQLLGGLEGGGRWLQCSFIVDAPHAEQLVLGVSEASIRRHGLVSEPVAVEMAIAALDHSNANLAIANVGRAETGAVCFAWAMLAAGWVRSSATTRVFQGSPDEVRRMAAQFAIAELPARHQELVRREQEELRRRFA